jgi:exodeoxyribonuclease VII small subunit
MATKSEPNNGDIAQLTYEQARDELKQVVAELEQQQVDLEVSLKLWERGEALAKHCEDYLSGAKRRLDSVLKERGD